MTCDREKWPLIPGGFAVLVLDFAEAMFLAVGSQTCVLKMCLPVFCFSSLSGLLFLTTMAILIKRVY